MTIAMTLPVGPEADTLDAHLLFHLNLGVDVVVVLDQGCTDEGREILDRHAQGGGVVLLGAEQSVEGVASAERVLERAAADLGADWMIPGDPSEFWWPRAASLGEILAAIPRKYGTVQALVRPFLPAEETEVPFYERMTYRISAQAARGGQDGRWRPQRRLAIRTTDAVAEAGGARDAGARMLRGWYPIEVFSFTIRSAGQAAREFGPEDYDLLALSAEDLERGLAASIVQVDTRLRDAVRALRAGLPVRLSRPSIVDDALLAAEAAALREGDVLAARERMDDLEHRLRALQASPSVRLEQKLRSLVGRSQDDR